jgi:type IV pilus assembly protein PilY1
MNFSLAASPVAADLDNDGFLDRIYIGDVGGQLWKFDVSAPATVVDGEVTNWTAKRLFVGDPDQANPPAAGDYLPKQGIYNAATLALDAYDNLWVYFGTGDRNAPKSASTNRFYAIKDDTDMTNGAALDESDLTDATTTDEVTQGWYLPLSANEKVLASASVFNQVVHFTTYAPVSVKPCEFGQGESQLYSVEMLSGDAGIDWDTGKRILALDNDATRKKAVGSGIPGEPMIVLGAGADTVVVATTDQEVVNNDMEASRVKDIRYWREVY